MTIWFDMDGTIADLYAVASWLDKLRAENAEPYENAAVMLNMSRFARYLHQVQAIGYKIGIISWLSKVSSEEYSQKVTEAKLNWLKRHLPSVEWDEINIVDYGTPKFHFATSENDILFDDEEKNRNQWGTGAFEPNFIFEILRSIITAE